MDLNKIAFVDIETTGCSPNHDRIIEIGILRVENNKLVEKYQTLVNPEVHLSSFITNLTGIKTEELENAPLFENIKEDVRDILEGCVFAAHNVRFDYGFIKQELKRFGYLYSSKMLCTARLSRTLYPQHLHHNLDSLILRHKFTCKRRHRAFDDAKILWDFYQTLHHQFNAKILTKAINKVMKKPSIPIRLTEEDLDTLPESPGVYIFYGENKMPLYIGKSKNIRDRVNSHFLQDHASLREINISKEVHRIETKTTSGELGALLMQSSLIKALQPLYNRKLRISKKIKKWPFNGPILIKEKNDEEQEEYFLIDKWCLLGSISNLESIDESTLKNEYVFDYDTYKILSGFLRSSNNLKRVKVLKKSQLKKFFALPE